MSKGGSDFRQRRRSKGGESCRPHHSGRRNQTTVNERHTHHVGTVNTVARNEQRLPQWRRREGFPSWPSILRAAVRGNTAGRPVDNGHNIDAARLLRTR
jgi:hypothetical protein